MTKIRHRHSGPQVRYRTSRGRIRYRKRPIHNQNVQTLIFNKKKFNRKKALDWAKDHGFKHNTSREEGNTIRVRQFPPSEIKRVGGTFPLGSNIQGLYAERKEGRRGSRRFIHLVDPDDFTETEEGKFEAAAHVKTGNIDDVFIERWPGAEENIDQIADIISHEELHNILSREIGEQASKGLDNITAPRLLDKDNNLINPKTAGEIFNTESDALEAVNEEVGGRIDEWLDVIRE